MPAVLMDGKAAAREVLAGIAHEIAANGSVGFATVVVSDDPAQHGYAARKHAVAREVGIDSRDERLSADTGEGDVLALVAELNADDGVDGVFVQLPLPPRVDAARVLAALEPAKDVDGLHPYNLGRLLLGDPALVPATPLAVLELLERYGVRLEGARAVVVGGSRFAGTPTALLLLAAHASVTVCAADAPALARHAAAADVLVAAANVPGLVTPELVKPGAAVVDAGLQGDVEPAVAELAGLLAPVPGGIGPLTIAMLLRNTVRAARYRRAAGH